MVHILTVLVKSSTSELDRWLKQLRALGVQSRGLEFGLQPKCNKPGILNVPEPISEDKRVRRTALSLV